MSDSWSNLCARLPTSLRCRLDDGIAVVTLNRPAKRNAIAIDMMDGLRLFFSNLAPDVKGVVIASEGENFSAGLDLNELSEKDAADGVLHSQRSQRALQEMQYSRVPVIAALKGAVIGAGLEIASAAHIRVAERSAYYGLPEASRGIFLGAGGSVRIARLLGVARVIDMMMTGRTLNAKDGYAFGLSQYLVDDGEGLNTALDVARRAAQNSTISTFAMVHALPRIVEMSPEEGLFTEALMAGIAQSSKEAKERLEAFLNKRAEKVARPKE
jgi:(methylthio)acryloyl-CoA hydratase